MSNDKPAAAPSPQPAVEPAPPKRRKPIVRTVFSVMLCLLILFIGVAGFSGLAALKKPPEAREQVVKVYNVEVHTVAKRDLEQRIDAHGTAAAERTALISAKVSGQVDRPSIRTVLPNGLGGASLPLGKRFRKAPLLKVGDTIKAGQVLIEIDPSTYQRKYALAKLKLQADDREMALVRQQQENSKKLVAEATRDVKIYQEEYDRFVEAEKRGAAVKSQLNQAKLELQRFKTLLLRETNQQSLYPRQLRQLENRRLQHQEELRLAELDLKHTRVVAEFSGTISEIHVQPGEFVKMDDPILKLTNSDVVEIPLPLAPEDHAAIASMVRGAKSKADLPSVQISRDEEAAYQWTGKIVRMAPMADKTTRTVTVFARIDNRAGHPSSSPVVPGMHYHAVILGPPLRNAVAVPREGILWKYSKTDKSLREAQVFIATKLEKKTVTAGDIKKQVWEGIAETRTVTVRQMLKSEAILDAGLKPGERLILTNLDVLHNGARVRFPAEK